MALGRLLPFSGRLLSCQPGMTANLLCGVMVRSETAPASTGKRSLPCPSASGGFLQNTPQPSPPHSLSQPVPCLSLCLTSPCHLFEPVRHLVTANNDQEPSCLFLWGRGVRGSSIRNSWGPLPPPSHSDLCPCPPSSQALLIPVNPFNISVLDV